MKIIDTNSMQMDFEDLFNSLSEEVGKELEKSKNILQGFNRAFKNLDYVTTLSTKGDGIVNIAMTTKPKEDSNEIEKDSTSPKEAEILKLMMSMNNRVLLRGSVYETGDIHSFWLKTSQKNLLAILFQLPKQPVKIGDSWPLDVNFISNDQNFECDSSYRMNKATLIDINKVKGETIAVLKYDILEFVNGDFQYPSLSGQSREPKKTRMKISHQGIAEFSVDKGRWIIYDAIMSIETTGFMKTNTKTKFTLTKEL